MKRWIVVIENFACIRPERFSYENYASRGAAEDAKKLINLKARMFGERVLASIIKNPHAQ